MAINTPRRPGVPAPKVTQTAPPPPTRERIVKRYIAFCGYESCGFTLREKPQPHGTRDAAIVEAVRHLRASHADSLVIERQARRTVQVQRTLLGEELVD